MKPFAILLLTVFCLAFSSQAQPSVKTKHANLEDGVALAGYDAVAYFVDSKAIEGEKTFVFVHEGITYRFSTGKNMEIFRKNPEKYKPMYGGWCAYAMGASAEKVEVDPETFKIVNGKLYLFYNKYFNNTLTKWNKDEDRLKKQADANWSKLTQ
jgi:YHS domain-containing protein